MINVMIYKNASANIGKFFVSLQKI